MNNRIICSPNLGCMPFLGSCDTTRSQMAAKQLAQALTHKNCEIPYVISENYRDLSNYSVLGLLKAKDSGKVIYNSDELLVIRYDNLNKIETYKIPEIKKTCDNYASTLRYSSPKNHIFNKNDIIYEYDCFREGVPSFGYNAFTAYINFFGLNHEDGIVISESFAKKAKYNKIDTVFIPIYDHTLLQPDYGNITDSLLYFPNIGQHINGNNVCITAQPKNKNDFGQGGNLKQKMMVMLKTMNISDVFNTIKNKNLSSFSISPITSKIHNGIVSEIKIHELKKNPILIDKQLHNVLKILHHKYVSNVIMPFHNDSSETCGKEFTNYLLKKNFIYKDSINRSPVIDSEMCYIIELTVTKEKETQIGDKFANAHANKGVVSEILPDELRPIAVESNLPIDFITSPFGVFSRMNISQMIEGIVAKNIMYCNSYIKEHPNDVENSLTWLNQNIIRHFSKDFSNYYNDVNDLIHKLKTDDSIKTDFINQVTNNNLFIEAPSFSKVNIKQIYKNSIKPEETVLIPEKTLKYLKQKLKIDIQFTLKDVYIKSLCVPIYLMKLNKLVEGIMSSRHLGAVKSLTKQPLKSKDSRASKLGQMEIEGIISHGAEKSLKELLTVKSDFAEGKPDLIDQIIRTGEYNINKNQVLNIEGGTHKIINTYLKFLKM